MLLLLRAQALPRTYTILRSCPSSILKSLHSSKLRRSISNYDIPPRIPQHFPQQSPGIPQYFPPQPPVIPQYSPQQSLGSTVPQLSGQQPLPRYFPQEPAAPEQLYNGKKYGVIIAGLMFVAFLGHCVQRNPAYRFSFSWCREEGLLGRENLEKLISSVGKLEFHDQVQSIERVAKMERLGPPHLLLPPSIGDDALKEAKIKESKIYLPPTNGNDPIKSMTDIVFRILQISNLKNRGEVGYVGYWFVTNDIADYSKFAQITPLIKSHCDGRLMIHKEAYNLLGNDDYAAFAVGRSIAPLILRSDMELLCTQQLSWALCGALFLKEAMRQKRSWGKALLKTTSLALVLELGLVNWTYRTTEAEADNAAIILISTAGFDITKATEALRKLEELQKVEPSRVSQILPEYLSRNNSLSTRIKMLEVTIPAQIAAHKEIKEKFELLQSKALELQQALEKEKSEAMQQANSKAGVDSSNSHPSPPTEKSGNDESNSR